STIRRWCDLAADAELDSPIFSIASAEVLLRQGRQVEAMRYAEAAASDENLAFRALSVAGRAAHLASRAEHALDLYRRAEAIASTNSDRRDAQWGQVMCAIELEMPQARESFRVMKRRLRRGEPREVLRATAIELSLQVKFGDIDLTEADDVAGLVDAV